MIDDKEILSQIASGNTKLFEQIVKKYSNAIYGAAYSKLGDYHMAQDVTQEVFVKAYLKLDTLKQSEKLGAWLYSLTKNACIDWFRKHKFTDSLDQVRETEADDIVADLVVKKEVQTQLKEALNSLPEANRQAVILYYLNGYSIKEISEFLNVPASTIENRVHRARKSLRDQLSLSLEHDLNKNKLGDDFVEDIEQICLHIQEYLWLTERYDEAIRELRKELKKNPNNTELKLTLADNLLQIWLKTKDAAIMEEAEGLFKEIAKADIVNTFYLTRFYWTIEKYDKAIALIKEMEDSKFLKYSVRDYKFVHGAILKDAGKLEEAETVIQNEFYHHFYSLLESLQILIDVQRKKQNKELIKKYRQVVIQLVEAVGDEPLRLHFAPGGYYNYAKLLVEDGLVEEALPYILKSKTALDEVVKKEAPKLFDKSPLFNGIPNEPDTKKKLDQYLLSTKVLFTRLLKELLDSEAFSVLSDDPNYIKIVHEMREDLEKYTISLEKTNNRIASSFLKKRQNLNKNF